jgi:hypothetical protein
MRPCITGEAVAESFAEVGREVDVLSGVSPAYADQKGSVAPERLQQEACGGGFGVQKSASTVVLACAPLENVD